MTLAATISDNATAITPTGGSAITLSPLGIQNGIASTFVSQDTAMLTRRTVDFSARDPKVNSNSPGGLTQARRRVVLNIPKVLTVGSTSVVTNQKVFIEMAFDASNTNADINNMLFLAAQLLGDNDLSAFWQAGALV